jgi:hypothetical protein
LPPRGPTYGDSAAEASSFREAIQNGICGGLGIAGLSTTWMIIQRRLQSGPCHKMHRRLVIASEWKYTKWWGWGLWCSYILSCSSRLVGTAILVPTADVVAVATRCGAGERCIRATVYATDDALPAPLKPRHCCLDTWSTTHLLTQGSLNCDRQPAEGLRRIHLSLGAGAQIDQHSPEFFHADQIQSSPGHA